MKKKALTITKPSGEAGITIVLIYMDIIVKFEIGFSSEYSIFFG
jgi:hypothetical protein